MLRRCVIGPALVLVLVASGCQQLRVEVPPSGAAPVDGAGMLAPPLREVWRSDAEAGFGDARPLIVGDAVLVATRQGDVRAYRLGTGAGLGHEGFGEAVEGTPAVTGGVLVVPVEWGRRALVGYDLPRARRLWAYRGEAVRADLAAADDAVVAADVAGRVRLVEARTGEERWRVDVGAPVLSGPVVVDGRVVVADERGRVRALALDDGGERWRHELGAPVHAALASDGTLVLAATTRGRLCALDVEQGERRWCHAWPDATVRVTTPTVAPGRAFVAATDGVVRALDLRTGEPVWQTALDEGVAAPPLITDGTLYAATLDGRLVALDAEGGAPLWEHELRGRVKSPMAARGGRLVVLSEPREVYLFQTRRAVASARDDNRDGEGP